MTKSYFRREVNVKIVYIISRLSYAQPYHFFFIRVNKTFWGQKEENRVLLKLFLFQNNWINPKEQMEGCSSIYLGKSIKRSTYKITK